MDFMDVPNSASTNLPPRAASINVAGSAPVATLNTHAFCDGGDTEGFLNDTAGLPGNADFGDPIRTLCAAEDDVCGSDKRLALVRSIRSVGTNLKNTSEGGIPNSVAFPTAQCSPNSFARVSLIGASAKVCPDGGAGNLCWMPYQTVGTTRNFNCLNRATSVPPGKSSATFDGRVYNAFLHSTSNSGEADLIALLIAKTLPSFRLQALVPHRSFRCVTNALQPANWHVRLPTPLAPSVGVVKKWLS
jgi:hypothetical protein